MYLANCSFETSEQVRGEQSPHEGHWSQDMKIMILVNQFQNSPDKIWPLSYECLRVALKKTPLRHFPKEIRSQDQMFQMLLPESNDLNTYQYVSSS